MVKNVLVMQRGESKVYHYKCEHPTCARTYKQYDEAAECERSHTAKK